LEDKILLVDDDDLVLACFQRMLGPHFTLDVALGPWAALEAIANRGPYAVIVSDMRMPGLNGIQLLEKVKEIAPDTIGIILSGNVEDIKSPPSDAKLIFKVIEKPCPFDKLNEVIREAVACHHENRLREQWGVNVDLPGPGV
jgi:DNA-binding NtrC family response regulator